MTGLSECFVCLYSRSVWECRVVDYSPGKGVRPRVASEGTRKGLSPPVQDRRADAAARP